MQIDELRSELTTLADEMTPFDGDVGALHSRARRRRAVGRSLVIALALVVAGSTVAVIRHRDNGRVHVSGAASKEGSAADLSHTDVIIVPATPTVQDRRSGPCAPPSVRWRAAPDTQCRR